MAVLTSKQRKALPKSDFALSGRRYPIPDAGHAKAALGRAAEFASPAEMAKVRAAVHRKFPEMSDMEMHRSGKPAYHGKA